MKTSQAVIAILLAGSLVSCSQESKEKSEREAGKAAYHFSEGAKKAAKAAGHELKVGAEEAHQGWKEAKQDAKEKKKDK